MYQGFMKRGVSIMAIFFGMLAFIAYFGIDELLFCLPVIWFYGFFDGIHRNSLPDEEYMQLKDEYLFVNDDLERLDLKRFRVPVAVLLIFIGGYSLLRTVIYSLVENVENLYWNSPIIYLIDDMLPKTVLSVVIIWLGVYLICGKKKEMEQESFGEKDIFQQEDASVEEPLASAFLQSEETTEEERDGGEEV